MDTVATIIHRKVRAEFLECTLFSRHVVLNRLPREPLRHAVLVTAGSGRVEGEADVAFEGPCVIWAKTGKADRLVLSAGAEAFLVGTADDLVTDAIGGQPEGVYLRLMLDRSFQVGLPDDAGLKHDLHAAFAAITREFGAVRQGSWMVLSAYLRVIFVILWRLSGAEELVSRSRGETSIVQQKFRQLVEIHFRDHWTVRAYADAIGITHDRLHAICTRELERTPLQLIHERLAYEAQLLLERSTLTAEQISHSLGFRDATHFSHFFKRRTGMAPTTYRRATTQAVIDGASPPKPSFADWP